MEAEGRDRMGPSRQVNDDSQPEKAPQQREQFRENGKLLVSIKRKNSGVSNWKVVKGMN